MSRRYLRAALLAAALVAPIGGVRAQAIGGTLVGHVRSSVGDAWDVWTSPFRANARDWLGAAGVLGIAAAVSPADAAVDQWAVHDRDDGIFQIVKPFREGGAAFSGKTITPVAIGVLAVAVVARNEPTLEGIFGCATSYAASSAVRTFVAYPLVARTRPDSSRTFDAPPARQGDQYHFAFPGTSDWGRHSFPGGHIANVAACAGFLTSRYHMGALAAVPWALVGAVGLSRTLDRRHWLSDEVVGAIFGYAVGKEVAVRSLRRKQKSSSSSNAREDDGADALFVSPTFDGARFGWRRSF